MKRRWICKSCGTVITTENKPPRCLCGAKEFSEREHDFEFLWEWELDEYQQEKEEWIIQDLVPAGSVGIWTGKRGTFKTFLLLSAIFAIGSGKLFLNRFETKKGKIIYLDKENGIPIMKQRKNMIKKGLEIEEPVDIGFICFSTLKLDRDRDIKEIETLIQKHTPHLLIVDTYRRGISFEENDAGRVSGLFVDVLRPLVEKYGLTIILIHHDRKGETQGDEMDMIRGSSDLANYADFIMKNERKGDNLILKQLKMRNAPEHQPIEIKVKSNQDSHITFISTGDYEPQTKDQKCAELLALWIVKNKIDTFQTKEAKEIAFKEGIKETNFKNALNLLINNGLISKQEWGVYQVISKNAKLV